LGELKFSIDGYKYNKNGNHILHLLTFNFMKFRFVFLLIFGVAVLFIRCTNKQHSDRKIFRYNESAGIATLDPAFAKNLAIMWPVHQIFNTLVELDSQLQIQPSLAASWSISDDQKTLRFFLRTDVYFHDNACFVNGKGRKLLASDVVYSFNRIINKETASPGAWIFNDKIENVNPFVVINDSVIELHLQKPCSSILGILSMQYCSIVPHEAIDKYGVAIIPNVFKNVKDKVLVSGK
jgi:peptide/nickel transport system substrate-binding protein